MSAARLARLSQSITVLISPRASMDALSHGYPGFCNGVRHVPVPLAARALSARARVLRTRFSLCSAAAESEREHQDPPLDR